MKYPKHGLAKACKARETTRNAGAAPTPKSLQAETSSTSLGAYDECNPEMERRLKAQSVWEFLDESKSTFYARMNVNDDRYDPLFPLPTPSSSKGHGPWRWKLGALINWLHICEANANNNA